MLVDEKELIYCCLRCTIQKMALNQSTANGDSSPFIEFILDIINETIETDQVSDQVSDQVKNLLSAMNGGEQKALELMKILSLSHRPTFRKNYLNPALNAGLIEMTIPDKPNSNLQKYRLIKDKFVR
jgi:hypothetical protein